MDSISKEWKIVCDKRYRLLNKIKQLEKDLKTTQIDESNFAYQRFRSAWKDFHSLVVNEFNQSNPNEKTLEEMIKSLIEADINFYKRESKILYGRRSYLHKYNPIQVALDNDIETKRIVQLVYKLNPKYLTKHLTNIQVTTSGHGSTKKYSGEQIYELLDAIYTCDKNLFESLANSTQFTTSTDYLVLRVHNFCRDKGIKTNRTDGELGFKFTYS